MSAFNIDRVSRDRVCVKLFQKIEVTLVSHYGYCLSYCYISSFLLCLRVLWIFYSFYFNFVKVTFFVSTNIIKKRVSYDTLHIFL